MEDYTKTTNEELKEKFIQCVGEDKWNQEEALSKLLPLEFTICNELGIEPIPVIADDIEEDARFCLDEEYIVISTKFILDDIEAKKCLIHELRHYYQYLCINSDKKDFLSKLWREEFKKKEGLIILEIDAYAYQKIMMKRLFDIDWNHPSDLANELINLYIEKYLK